MEEKTTKKSFGKLLIGIAVLFAVAIVMFAVFWAKTSRGSSTTGSGSKKVEITVVHGNKSEKKFSYKTNAVNLAELIKKEKLVEGTNSTYGFFINAVDGEKADKNKKQWWCIMKDKKMLDTGAERTPVENGDKFELVLKEGY